MAFTGDIDFKSRGINFEYTGQASLPNDINVLDVTYVKNESGDQIIFDGNRDNTFNLGEPLAKGSYGSTYKITNKFQGIDVIVKIISREKNINEQKKYDNDIIKEAMVQIIVYESSIDKLMGPYAPNIFLIGMSDDYFFVICERLTETIANLLDTNRVDLQKKTISFTRDLAYILKELYDLLQFNHRDLKPNNVMYATPFQIRIIDFGFSCLKYKNLEIFPESKAVWITKLRNGEKPISRNSKVRDMHQFIYYILNQRILPKYGARKVERVYNILNQTENFKKITWNNSYAEFGVTNNIASSKIAENCDPDVVYKIFSTELSELSDSMHTKELLKPIWTQHLKKLYIESIYLITPEEYKYVRIEVKKEFLTSFTKSPSAITMVLNMIISHEDHLTLSAIEPCIVIYINRLVENAKEYEIKDLIQVLLSSQITSSIFFTKHTEQLIKIIRLVIDRMFGDININNLINRLPENLSKFKSNNLLEYAVLKNKEDIAAALIEYKKGISLSAHICTVYFLLASANFGESLLEKISTAWDPNASCINVKDDAGMTPLMKAAQNRNVNAVKVLSRVPGALFTLQDLSGNTCLHYASGKDSYHRSSTYSIDIIKHLIGLHPELVDIKNKDGMGPGNPKWVGNQSFRDLIKSKKSVFGYANTEKHKRNAHSQGRGGRKTRRGKRRRVSGNKTARL